MILSHPTRTATLSRRVKCFLLMPVYRGRLIVGQLLIATLWLLSYPDTAKVNTLIQIPAISLTGFIALVLLATSFCYALQRDELPTWIYPLHILAFIFIMHSISAKPSEQSGVGFLALAAFISDISGIENLSFLATKSNLFLSSLFMGALSVFFSGLSHNRRVIMSKDTIWFIVITLSVLFAFVAPFISVSAIRLPFMLWFILLCPGMSFVRLLKIKHSLLEFTLAVGLSLSLATVVSTAVLYLHLWNPLLIQFALIALTSFGIILQFLQQHIGRFR